MSKHTRAFKNAERELTKRITELDALRARRDTLNQVIANREDPEEDGKDSVKVREDLDAAILHAQARVKKAKSKVEEAEMFVMRNRY